jgi:hypothetical protein
VVPYGPCQLGNRGDSSSGSRADEGFLWQARRGQGPGEGIHRGGADPAQLQRADRHSPIYQTPTEGCKIRYVEIQLVHTGTGGAMTSACAGTP